MEEKIKTSGKSWIKTTLSFYQLTTTQTIISKNQNS